MRRASTALLPFALVLTLTCSAQAPEAPAGEDEKGSAPPARAVELHAEGLAALENEQAARAEELYASLAEVLPEDPLPWANLAVARLRQQETEGALEAADRALDAAVEGEAAGRIHAIRGAVLDWSGQPEAAYEAYARAAELAPDDPEILYSLYRQAVSLGRDEDAGRALERLAEARPDNFVLLLERGKQSIQRGDRAAATEVFLRVEELLWQAPPVAETALEGLREALESGESAGDLSTARVPAARLENVLKVTPMYRESLRELSQGIQAVPFHHFGDRPEAEDLGPPLDVRFAGERLSDAATLGRAMALADLDGDDVADVARIVRRPGGNGAEAGEAVLVVHLSGGGEREALPAPDLGGVEGLLAADLRNDRGIDLVAFGPSGVVVWEGTAGENGVELALAGEPGGEDKGLAGGFSGEGGRAAAVTDYDLEADLDLVLAGSAAEGASANGSAGGPALRLYRNPLEGPLEAVGEKVFRGVELPSGTRAVEVSDLDRDGDPDLIVAGAYGIRWLDNLRHGVFADRTAGSGLEEAPATRAVVAADLDNDGLPDLAAAGPGGLALWRNGRGGAGRFEPWSPAVLPQGGAAPGEVGEIGEIGALAAFDADNDGRLDLALAGANGVTVLGRDTEGGFRTLAVEGGPASATAVAAADLDGDGDLDLLAAGPEGLHRLENRGGHENHHLRIRLVGLTQGNSKNNVNAVGAVVEVKVGGTYQLREHDGRASHFGLGRSEAADVVRVVWNNGVPQNRVDVAGDRTIVEEQVLKGSCPFLYAWNGEEMAFVTDLLWGSPAGLPVAEGVWAPADAEELVEVVGARPLSGDSGEPGAYYDLRITEELWEAAYFDRVRLWVVDHPEEVAVASSLKIVPGEVVPDRVLGSRGVRPVAAAWDGRGRDVTARVRERDHVYADGYEESLYQGLAREPWSLTFELGNDPTLATGAPVRLLLDGWIFPTDASINIALAQRPDLALQAPRLEVETADGWRVLMPNMGHPAGKTKTMVVDTPPLPPRSRRLRIVTNQWLHWDRIAWTPLPTGGAEGEVRVVERLVPARADLRFRGFSALVRRAPNAPHEFDYDRLTTVSPWQPVRGPYTRHGDVRELLLDADSRSVVMAPGDEMVLRFDAAHLPPPPPGHRRTVFLESHGWDKDYDKHTYAVDRGSLPLPFHGMKVYPWAEGEGPPEADAEALEELRREWLTREAPGPEGGRGTERNRP